LDNDYAKAERYTPRFKKKGLTRTIGRKLVSKTKNRKHRKFSKYTRILLARLARQKEIQRQRELETKINAVRSGKTGLDQNSGFFIPTNKHKTNQTGFFGGGGFI
jgi:hypothetical protein